MNTVTGIIKAISKVETMQSQGGNTFTKQSVFLDNGRYDQDTGERYDNDLLLDFINHKDGDIAQSFKKGDKVTVTFRLRGRSWKSKSNPNKTEWGVGVSCFRIEPFQPQNGGYQQNVQQAPQQAAQPAYNPQPAPQPQVVQQEDDGLPF